MAKLDSRVQYVWVLQYIARFLVILILIGIGDVRDVWGVRSALGMDTFVPTLLCAGVLLVYTFTMPFIRYNRWSYDLLEDEFHVHRGVFTQIHTVAPVRRIQHLDVAQNVLEKMFGIAKLVIYTAGSRGADIVIPGLELEYAELVRDELKNTDEEDAV